MVKGGRYDNLLGRFGKSAPAIGFMVVMDDLMAALDRQNIAIALPERAEAVEYTPENYKESLKKAQKLRQEGKKAVLRPKT